jgi:ribosomal RNA-processing protein 8
MSLFEVDGWAVNSAPVREATQRLSKKRKRPFDHNEIESTEVNVEKLMAKLTSLPETSTSSVSGSRNVEEYHGPRKKKKHTLHVKKNKEEISCARGVMSLASVTSSKNCDRESSSKKTKHQRKRGLHPSKTTFEDSKQKIPSDTSLTPLQKGMKESLDGARFRLVC